MNKTYSQIFPEGDNCSGDDQIVVVPVVSFNQCDNNPWVLVFQDEFDGNSLDNSKWHAQTGVPRDPYFGSQKAWHKPENVTVSDGTLKIISKKENSYNMPVVTSWSPYTVKYDDFEYSTGEIWTNARFENGRFDARIKIPKGKGFFPAFWLYGDIPKYNEIDIFEFWDNSTTKHHMSIHTKLDDQPNRDCERQYNGPDFSADFHIFTCIWEKNVIYFYMDGELQRTDNRYITIQGQQICNITAWQQYIMNIAYPINPMAIVLNTAIQYNSPYAPDASTIFPAQLEVDWVHYYKRMPCLQTNNITMPSQIIINDVNFNVISGNDVNIYCTYNLQANKQLEIVAKNSIEIGPNFTTDPNSNFEARIEATVCGTLRNQTINNANEEIISKDLIESKSVKELTEILIYPNPNNGEFSIDFTNKDFSEYSVKITNLIGDEVYSKDKIENSVENIQLKNNLPGEYILYLINNKTLLAITHKLLLK